MFSLSARNDRAQILQEVTRRVVFAEKRRTREGSAAASEILINEALFQERERLKGLRRDAETRAQSRFWDGVAGRFHRVTEAERWEILESIARLYVEEIHGTFNPRLHNVAARILARFLKLLLSRVSPSSFLSAVGERLDLEENLIVTGPVETLRSLAERGTLILAPTHVSNLDSIVIGLGLHRSRLPPFTYGAGLNLFSNPVLSFFMNNLGAYKVDRRKKNTLYKDTLKEYAAHSMERGQHNLFFPGGTRNRRGDVERHLKLGLLGCGLSAYLENLRRGRERPDVFVVPATLSYGLVLEAKSLIEDHLREQGKSRFIQIRGDFSRPVRMLRFWKNLQSLNSEIHLHFCEPLDLFGNAVDAEGVSRDARGRPVDRVRYVQVDGVPAPSPSRDREYTRELGRALEQAYLRDNLALCTHAAAFAVFEGLRREYPAPDLYRFLRFKGPECALTLEQALSGLESLLAQMREAASAGRLRLEAGLSRDAREVFDAALAHFRSYHDGEAMLCEGGRVYSLDLKLLYYYRNRIDHYGFRI